MRSDVNRNVVMRRISVLYQVCGGRDVTRFLTHPLRMLVCTDTTDTASLQRLFPVAVICLKKLFWEIADSVITRSCCKHSLSLNCSLEQMEICVIGLEDRGHLTTKFSRMCIR